MKKLKNIRLGGGGGKNCLSTGELAKKSKNPLLLLDAYDLDDPRRTLLHRDIILKKSFLRQLYSDWYRCFIAQSSPLTGGRYLEVGSGGGFLKSLFPEAITSDILELDGVDMVCSAERLPFADGSLASIMMLNVFHHIPHPYLFLEEAQRALMPGGKIIMVEPANSLFSRFIYTRFHHEPFAPDGKPEIEAGNPLSGSNQAMPYIYFERDRKIFEEQFPSLTVKVIRYHTPFLYLISGGLSHPSLLPGFLYRPARWMESLFAPFYRLLGLFCTIVVEKKAAEHDLGRARSVSDGYSSA
jgi:SAM-dependent methyltransferase